MANILIVDDDYSVRELYKYILENFGHTVMTAKNGKDALEKIVGFVPDCMLVDISMPEMDGREFISSLKRPPFTPRMKDIPFVVLTGESVLDLDMQYTFQENGACRAFLPKMSDPDSVAKKVLDILSGRA